LWRSVSTVLDSLRDVAPPRQIKRDADKDRSIDTRNQQRMPTRDWDKRLREGTEARALCADSNTFGIALRLGTSRSQ
jgi:hypothetical protein